MFAYQGGGLPRLSDFAAAAAFYEKAKTWRGDAADAERKLDGAKRHTTIRKLDDGSIACKLYRTDVITYHPDNTITAEPWSSRSTDAFFNGLSPYRLSSSFTHGVIQVGERYYRAVKGLKIDLSSMEPLTVTEPFKFSTINRERAKKARDRYEYTNFATYATMSEKMGVRLASRAERLDVRSTSMIIACLEERESWPHLLVAESRAQYEGAPISSALTLSNVRQAIYATHLDVHDNTEEPFLTSWDDIQRWKRN